MTINKLRDRVGVAPMVVSEIDENFDPNRDKGTAPWTRNYDAKTTMKFLRYFGKSVANVWWNSWDKALASMM